MMKAASVHTIPLLLSSLTGFLLGWIAWQLWRSQAPEVGESSAGMHKEMSLWLLIMAAFALGALVTYMLLSIR